jgi:non-specific serine/threonine protein kinase
MTGTNLPLELTSFVGREHELQLIVARLGKAHLVTLTGTGGCGKTRLACQVARRRRRAYPGGVWLIELGNVTDGELIVETVAQVVGVPEASSSQPLLARSKARRSALLVLDTGEHLASVRGPGRGAAARMSRRTSDDESAGAGITEEAIVWVPSLAPDATPTDLTALGRTNRSAVRGSRERNQSLAWIDTPRRRSSTSARLDGTPLAEPAAACARAGARCAGGSQTTSSDADRRRTAASSASDAARTG